MRFKNLIIAATLVAASTPASAAPFSTLVVFGDSLSDGGNLTAIISQALPGAVVPAVPPYAMGHASNGPVAVEYMAAQLGLGPLVPAALGGNNYAVIGAATDEVPIPGGGGATADNSAELLLGGPLPVDTALGYQVDRYLLQNVGPLDANALFFVWAGANDLFIDPSVGTAEHAADSVAAAVKDLYDRGGRQFFVPNLPNLGRTPSAGAGAAALQALTAAYNIRLATNLAGLGGLPAIQLTQFDTFALFEQMALNPGAFGFTNVSDPCVLGNPAAAQRSPNCGLDDEMEFLFWDGVHPTTSAHRILGASFAQAVPRDVPEPATMVLTGVGVAALATRRRRSA